MSDSMRPSQIPVEQMNPPELAEELQWWAKHTDTSTGYGRGLALLLAAASAMVQLGVPCPECDKEAVCRGKWSGKKWLHCFACGANFSATSGTTSWTCGCGHVNGINLSRCAQCKRRPGETV